jgi:hypothetical protein
MSPLLIPLFSFGEKLLDKFVTTPEEKARAQFELTKLLTETESKEILAQLEINSREAQHSSIFVAGWRPFVGWICGIGLGYQAIIHNLLAWLAKANGWELPPSPDTDILIYVLGGLLGLGTLRTYEKKQGVTK